VGVAELAEKSTFDRSTVLARAESFRQQTKQYEETFKKESKITENQIKARESDLKKLPQDLKKPEVVANRRKIQCDLLKIKRDFSAGALTFFQKQVASDVAVAKLNLLADWKTKSAEIDRMIADETIDKRQFGNALDIGNRGNDKPFRGQEDDIKWGDREVENAVAQGVLPRPLDDPEVVEYVTQLGQQIAKNSDLQVPLKVHVVQKEEVQNGRYMPDEKGMPRQVANAMMLPGGHFFLYVGMIQEADTESELAGVIAHEMSHAAARHAKRLSSRGTLLNLLSTVSIIALSIFTPGLFSAATYLGYQLKGLLLQAIFNAMGLVFTLNILGVSRDFELEADQLGMQYAWKAGYDPRGFVNLFDTMSKREGYASWTAFFATHPAFGDRITKALEEHRALRKLHPEENYITDSTKFQQVKIRLAEVLKKEKEKLDKEPGAPSLLRKDEVKPEDCPDLQPPSKTGKSSSDQTGFLHILPVLRDPAIPEVWPSLPPCGRPGQS
jgi:Zn-dependent protease with chaperone function